MTEKESNPARYVLVDETSRELVYGARDQEVLTAAEVIHAAKTMGHDYCAYPCPEETVERDSSGHVIGTNENQKRFDQFLQNRDPNQAVYILRMDPLEEHNPDWFRKEAGVLPIGDILPEPRPFPKRCQTGYVIHSDSVDLDLSFEDGIGPFYDPAEAEEAFTSLLEDPEQYDQRTMDEVMRSTELWSDRPTCDYSLLACSDVLANDDRWGDAAYQSPARMTGSYTCFFEEDSDTGYSCLEETDLEEWHYSPEFLNEFEQAGEQPQYKDYMDRKISQRNAIFEKEEERQIQGERNRKEFLDEWTSGHGPGNRERDETEPNLSWAISRGAEAHDRKKEESDREPVRKQPLQKGAGR